MNAIRNTITSNLNSCSRNFQMLLNRNVAYKSAISLQSLYPNSSLKLTTPTKPESALTSKFSGFIPIDQLDISYMRSSGPGGQNVNKVNTKVDLRFHLESAGWLDKEIKIKLAEKLKTKISKDGFLIFRSDLTRSQQMNLADCLEKIRCCVLDAIHEPAAPSIESLEKIRKRHERAARERLMQKRERSQIKADRQGPNVRDINL